MNTIFEKIRVVIEKQVKENKLKITSISLNSSFAELGFNSVNYISLIVKLEDIFDIEFDDDILTYNNQSIKTICDYIATQVS